MTPDDWLNECRRLRQEKNLSLRALAAHFGKSLAMIRYAVDPVQKERVRHLKRLARIRRARFREENRLYPQRHDLGVEHWTKRKPNLVSQDVINAAVMAYSRGEIDRHEMVRRMAPR